MRFLFGNEGTKHWLWINFRNVDESWPLQMSSQYIIIAQKCTSYMQVNLYACALNQNWFQLLYSQHLSHSSVCILYKFELCECLQNKDGLTRQKKKVPEKLFVHCAARLCFCSTIMLIKLGSFWLTSHAKYCMTCIFTSENCLCGRTSGSQHNFQGLTSSQNFSPS